MRSSNAWAETCFQVTKHKLLTLGHSNPVEKSREEEEKYVQCLRHLACASHRDHSFEFSAPFVLKPMSYSTELSYCSLITNLLHLDKSSTFKKCHDLHYLCYNVDWILWRELRVWTITARCDILTQPALCQSCAPIISRRNGERGEHGLKCRREAEYSQGGVTENRGWENE